ncbi:MAG: site-2 protease family protein [Candidatus Micrarchaeota archaeon]|nr:site-2 protease family protein [Candidatus Micrarchaeota archaeon]
MQTIYTGSSISSTEVKNIVVADVVLTIAFALVFSGGLGNLFGAGGSLPGFIALIPIAFVAVSLSFVLHELMHKVVAQRYGAAAAFRASKDGLLITIVSGAIGFLIGIPGATVIFASNFSKRQEALVSLAGPLTNFAVFLGFLSVSIIWHGYLSHHAYLTTLVGTTLFISVWIAFFNMLPVYPLDGSKVLRWNKFIYIGVLAVIFLFFYVTAVLYFQIYSPVGLILNLVVVLVLALIMSSIATGIRI